MDEFPDETQRPKQCPEFLFPRRVKLGIYALKNFAWNRIIFDLIQQFNFVIQSFALKLNHKLSIWEFCSKICSGIEQKIRQTEKNQGTSTL